METLQRNNSIDPLAQGVQPRAELAPPSTSRGLAAFLADPRALWFLALIPHTVAIAFSFVAIVQGHGGGNLPDFLGASRDMLRGKDIYSGGTHGYVYPPLIAFLYQPLVALSDRSAEFITLAIDAVLSVITLVLTARFLVSRLIGNMHPRLIASVALFGALCSLDKIKGEFSHLETNVLMLFAFTVALLSIDTRAWLCGLALGFAFNIKYMPLALVPYLLLRRRWAAVLWFAIWALIFALLPSISMGWKANAQAWAQASGGLLRLFGVHSQVAHMAHVKLITDPVSISLTSGLARTTGLPSPWPLTLAACLAAIFCLSVAIMYRRNRLPLFQWPQGQQQTTQPYRGLMPVEWMAILLLILIFSPFTNSRHLYMLLDINLAAGVLLLGTEGVIPRAPLLIATIIMALGISMPPGGKPAFERAGEIWRGIGGPAWCMLAMFTLLIWTNVRYQRSMADPNS